MCSFSWRAIKQTKFLYFSKSLISFYSKVDDFFFTLIYASDNVDLTHIIVLINYQKKIYLKF